MRPLRLLLLAPLLACAATGLALGQEPPSLRQGPAQMKTSCVECHSQLDGTALEPVEKAKEDVHFMRGFSCHHCHGGDPTVGFDGDPFAAHDEAKGFRGKPTRLQIPGFCGECHADATFMKKYDPQERVDQLSEYRTSVHGIRNAAGDENVAVCSDCHGAHGILQIDDPRTPVHPLNLADTCAHCHADASLMAQYKLKTDQHAAYKSSVHARAIYEKGDISAPTCNDCHGSHGASPPGVQGVSNVCGSCHGREATLFREIEAKRDLDLEACIQCVICHGNHAVLPPTEEMVGIGPKSTCTGCHVEGEPGWSAAAEMGESLVELRDRLERAHGVLRDAERAGVEVGPDLFALQAAQDSLVEGRVLVHSFDIERFRKVAEEGLTAASAGLEAGDRAFSELRFRRMGLWLSLIVIVAVIGALALKIRRIEQGG